MSGIERIAAERERQVAALGYSTDHDDEHIFGELSGAAAAYVEHAGRQIALGIDYTNAPPPSNLWRWSHDAWKPSPDPIRNLAKAGALIAAEIDRLERENGTASMAGKAWLLPCPGCKRDAVADDGHRICRECEGYKAKVTTPAEQEAERRYVDEPNDIFETNVGWGKQLAREAFVAGAEWSESRYRELLDAAREYRETRAAVRADQNYDRDGVEFRKTITRLLAAAAALEEAGEDAG